MGPQAAPSVWDPNQYWLKAKSYVIRAQEYGSDSADYALWYALALEHLARAALCSIHPVLNADPQHLPSVFYSIGVIRTQQPKSIPIHSVYNRLVQLLDNFTGVHESFCGEIANRRNAELHSAELPFNGLNTGSWLARYYEIVEILCSQVGHSLEEFLGESEAEGAHTLIVASKSDGLGKVKQRVAKHRMKFSQLSLEKRSALQAAAAVSVRWHWGTVAECSACKSDARLEGTPFREGKIYYDDTQLLVDITYLSNYFKCSVCDLELRGEDEILFAGMPPTFTKTESTSLHELFDPEFEDEYMNM